MKGECEIRVTYHYIEPKTEEEAKGYQKNTGDAFNILFGAALEVRQPKLFEAQML